MEATSCHENVSRSTLCYHTYGKWLLIYICRISYETEATLNLRKRKHQNLEKPNAGMEHKIPLLLSVSPFRP